MSIQKNDKGRPLTALFSLQKGVRKQTFWGMVCPKKCCAVSRIPIEIDTSDCIGLLDDQFFLWICAFFARFAVYFFLRFLRAIVQNESKKHPNKQKKLFWPTGIYFLTSG